MNRTSARLAVLLTGDAVVLLTVRPRWYDVGTGLAHPRCWLAAAGPDVALAAVCVTLLWLAAAWLGVGLLAGVGTRVPGATGRVCTRLARVVVPTVLVRVVLGSTALGLLVAPAAAASARPAPAGATAVAAAPVRAMHPATDGVSGPVRFSPWTGLDVPSPTWPVTPSASTPVAPPTWPAGGTRTPVPTPGPPVTPRTPTAPAPRTGDPSTGAPRTGTSRTGVPTARVHRGDSLWLLAARRLGPHADAGAVAHYWPQLYAANRGVIGDDPSAIHPGQVLHLPAPTQEPS